MRQATPEQPAPWRHRLDRWGLWIMPPLSWLSVLYDVGEPDRSTFWFVFGVVVAALLTLACGWIEIRLRKQNHP